MNGRLARVLALLPWLLCACTSSPTTETPGRAAFPAGEGDSQAPPADPTLYGWDGSVAAGGVPGQVNQRANPGHGLEPTIEGRMHILELYQAVLDERDALATEVQALTKALERTEADLVAVRGEKAELETRVSAEERAKEGLLQQNLELSGRLTTAQIRRLEAEKLLLETRIAWQKEKTPAPASDSDIDEGP